MDDRKRSVQQGSQTAQEGREVPRRGLRGADERIEVVEGSAEVDEGRVRLPEGGRQCTDGAVERGRMASDRVEGQSPVRNRAREVSGALRERRDELRRVDHELLEELRS